MLGSDVRRTLFGRVLLATGLSDTATGVFDVAAVVATSSSSTSAVAGTASTAERPRAGRQSAGPRKPSTGRPRSEPRSGNSRSAPTRAGPAPAGSGAHRAGAAVASPARTRRSDRTSPRTVPCTAALGSAPRPLADRGPDHCAAGPLRQHVSSHRQAAATRHHLQALPHGEPPTLDEPVPTAPPVIKPSSAVVSPRSLSQDERLVIAELRRAGLSSRAIAAQVRRSPSTVSRELARNSRVGRPVRRGRSATAGGRPPPAAAGASARGRPGPARLGAVSAWKHR